MSYEGETFISGRKPESKRVCWRCKHWMPYSELAHVDGYGIMAPCELDKDPINVHADRETGIDNHRDCFVERVPAIHYGKTLEAIEKASDYSWKKSYAKYLKLAGYVEITLNPWIAQKKGFKEDVIIAKVKAETVKALLVDDSKSGIVTWVPRSQIEKIVGL